MAQPRSLWRSPTFMRFWGSETLSQTGIQISSLALPLTAISVLGAGPGLLGVLSFAQTAPILALSLFVGTLTRRYGTRALLVWTNLVRCVAIAVVPVAYLGGVLSAPLLVTVVLVIGVMTAIFDVVYVAGVPQLVHRDQVSDANAKLEATYSVSEAGGPGLGGLLVQLFSAPLALIANAVTFGVAGLMMLGTRVPEESRNDDEPSRSVWSEVRQGVSVIMQNGVLRPLVLQSAAYNLLAQVPFTLFILYGVEQLRLSPGVLGVLLSVGSVGALVGAVVAGRAARLLGTGATLAWAMLLASATLLALPAAAGSTEVVLAAIGAGLVLNGIGLGVFNVHSLNARTELVPRDLLAYTTGAWRVISNGPLPLSGLLAAVLGQLLGVRLAMLVAVALLTVCAACFLFSGVRSFNLTTVRSVPGDAHGKDR